MNKTITLIAEIATVLGFNYAVFMWIAAMNRTRKDVAEIKNNHLVHVTHYLRLICIKLGIEYTEPEGKDGHD